ncbi:hypothetical protein KIKIMORA_05090 [Brevundimonas phage vB_BpoS-Kikimora]|uniref:Uncharacterized protein n=1 Tax=Brevundimonas phage vB_BpoS-Kikimora TaxID=2948601 RepID=A0A9E7SMX3_9CAUD|nr:hypothetical protein KIKIMORA_05090 [Brevundimonas phage vB_BpoS-Kikimora]
MNAKIAARHSRRAKLYFARRAEEAALAGDRDEAHRCLKLALQKQGAERAVRRTYAVQPRETLSTENRLTS